MAQFTTQCPHCKQQFNAQTEWVGQKTECPICKRPFIISYNQCETIKREKSLNCSSLNFLNIFSKNKKIFVIIAILCIVSGIFKTISDMVQIENIRDNTSEVIFSSSRRFESEIKYVLIDSIDSFCGGALLYGYFTQSSDSAIRKKLFYRDGGKGNMNFYENLYHDNMKYKSLENLTKASNIF